MTSSKRRRCIVVFFPFQGNVDNYIIALRGMQTRSSDENSVCPSVCLSARLSKAWIVTKRKKDLSGFLYHTNDYLGLA